MAKAEKTKSEEKLPEKETTTKDISVNDETETYGNHKKVWILGGFFEFLKQYSVIGLAIGIVIGDASKNLVNTLVASVLTPFLGLFTPSSQSLQDLKITLRNQDFMIGNMIQASLSFIIILFVLYFTIKILLRRDDLLEKK